MLGWSVIRGLQKASKPKQLLSFAGISIMSAFLFVLLYWILWIIPNNGIAFRIWQYEGISRVAEWQDIPGTIRFWMNHIYFDRLHAFHTGMFLCVTIVFLVLVALKKIRPGWTGFLWLAWLIFELHKLILVDQPPRYQVSFLAATGFFVAYMIGNIQSSENRWIKLVAILLVSLYAGKFSGDVRWMIRNRTYTLQAANDHIAQSTAKGDTVLGVWSGSLGWKSEAYLLPVWSGYINDTGMLARFHPAVILSEPGEDDSNGAFRKDGIILDTASAKKFTVGYWNIDSYKISAP
jgi:hypothetical protein